MNRRKQSMPLGVIVEVEGSFSVVGMYNISNDTNILWYGHLLAGPRVGALLTINQNNIKIIAKVCKEKILDEQNRVTNKEFDNRFSKGTINRVITLKTQGVIANHKFQVTSSYVPMVGNEVTLTTKEELDIIFSIDNDEKTICIGHSILERQPIDISINKFFASHIGIFGNTGSGKSNTLHKLYLELFRKSKKESLYDALKKKSSFFVIDFNGEYTGDNHFGIELTDKKICKLSTRGAGDKLPVKASYLFDADILAILFDAKPATQIPFLRSAMKKFNEENYAENSFADLEIGLLRSLLKNNRGTDSASIENWINAAKNFGVGSSDLKWLEKSVQHLFYGNDRTSVDAEHQVLDKDGFTDYGNQKIDSLQRALESRYNKETSRLSRLKTFLEFQKVYMTAWGSTKLDYINPLFKRIESAFESLEKVIDLHDNLDSVFSWLNIVSLVNVNQEIKRLVPMLLSKMIYEEQKQKVAADGKVENSCHLIIDEAHNILNSVVKNTGDSWQDYRLSVFEEIIKEGRKFGFYLTLASQRPSDISPTIMSQIHNYFIHRLVNEQDLKMLASTMPTLDSYSSSQIPSLGQGEAIITGTAMKMPIMVKVDEEKENHPQSDDVNLVNLWSTKSGDSLES